ncbi:MAG: YhcH/YjgK/YiaL family protein [Bacteroidota bacterium]
MQKTFIPNLAKAIDHVLQTDFTNAAAGKYEIEGDSIFYMVNEYMTKPAIECEPNGTEIHGYTNHDQRL